MTFQETLRIEKTPSGLKRMMTLGLYSVAIVIGAMVGLMGLLLVA